MSDTVLMPKELTGENGAKFLLNGEFSENIDVNCSGCNSGTKTDPSGSEYECEECNGTGWITETVPVTWTTIKEIYAMAVKNLAIKA